MDTPEKSCIRDRQDLSQIPLCIGVRNIVHHFYIQCGADNLLVAPRRCKMHIAALPQCMIAQPCGCMKIDLYIKSMPLVVIISFRSFR